MTAAERQAWLALYAVSWHFHSSSRIVHVTDKVRAHQAAEQATRGLQALRDLSVEAAEGRSDLENVVEVFE